MKAIEKDIRKNFKGDKNLDAIVKYYFDNLGGDGGCEDCGKTLCWECLHNLRREQYRLNRIMAGVEA